MTKCSRSTVDLQFSIALQQQGTQPAGQQAALVHHQAVKGRHCKALWSSVPAALRALICSIGPTASCTTLPGFAAWADANCLADPAVQPHLTSGSCLEPKCQLYRTAWLSKNRLQFTRSGWTQLCSLHDTGVSILPS